MNLKGRSIWTLCLCLLAISIPFLAMKCSASASAKVTHDWQCHQGTEVGGSVTGSWLVEPNLSEVGIVVVPPSWLEYQDVSSQATLSLQGQDASGNTIIQTVVMPLAAPGRNVVAPSPGSLSYDLTPTADQQNSYNSFTAAVEPSSSVDFTCNFSVGDERILQLSRAVYQPYSVQVSIYKAGTDVGDFTLTQSLSAIWKGYLLSAISQVPPQAWATGKPFKPTYQTLLQNAVRQSMAEWDGEDPVSANRNLLIAMDHLNQYISDPAQRDNLYSIFLKVQQHVQNVASRVPETP